MESVIVFFNDIAIITSGTFDDHLTVLKEVLSRLCANNLQVNGKKSHFCETEAEFLGFLLTRNGVKPQVNKVKAVMRLAQPKTVKQVRSFIGMINYYKDHIPH
jgi:hypothetical protein